MGQQALELCQHARGTGLVTRWETGPQLGAVLVAGSEGASFLQAQLTSDVAALEPGSGQLSARLDRRGSLVSWFHLLRLPDRGQPFASFFLILPRAEIAPLLADLSGYIINEDVHLEDVSAEFDGVLIQGMGAEDLLHRAWESGHPPGLLRWAFSVTGDPGFLCLAPKDAALLDHLLDVAAQGDWAFFGNDPDSRLAWQWLRVEAGLPLVGADLDPGTRALPQTGLEQQVVSTTKGCYLGQEVVARIRTYGSVPRALRGLEFPGLGIQDLDRLPEPGQELRDSEGKVRGTWASSGWSVARQASVALAFLDRDSRRPGQVIEFDLGAITTAHVQLLPFYSAVDQAERAENLYERAVRIFSQGQDDEAASLLEESLRLDPASGKAYEALGVILGRSQRYHEAIDIFRRLEELAPDEPMVHTNLSLYYMKVGDREEAERQKALGTMKRFASLAPEGAASAAEAEKQTRRLDAERKQAMFAEVLALDPEDPLALMGLGNALVDLDQLEEAESCLTRALAVQKDNSPLYLTCGKVLEKLQRTDEAVAVFQRGIEVASRRGDLMPLREMEHRLALLRGLSAQA